jgi:hypothetical protein
MALNSGPDEASIHHMLTPRLPGFGVLIVATMLFTSLECSAQESGTGKTGIGATGPAWLTPGISETQQPTEMLPVQFQATFYEVQADADRVGALDAKALARQAATPEALLKALSGTAKSRILYRIDQPVNVYSERITVGSSEPVVMGTRMNPGGQAINSIRYQNVGVIVRLSAQTPPPDANREAPDVKMAIQLAALAPSETEIAPGQKATATRTVSIEHSEPLEFGRPLVMLAVSSSSAAEQVTPAVYVIRYLFSPPVSK